MYLSVHWLYVLVGVCTPQSTATECSLTQIVKHHRKILASCQMALSRSHSKEEDWPAIDQATSNTHLLNPVWKNLASSHHLYEQYSMYSNTALLHASSLRE